MGPVELCHKSESSPSSINSTRVAEQFRCALESEATTTRTQQWTDFSVSDLVIVNIKFLLFSFRPAVINTGVETSSSPCASWSARPRGAGSNGVQGPPSKTFPDNI